MGKKVQLNIEIEGKEIVPISSLLFTQPFNQHHVFELRCPLDEKDESLQDYGRDYIGKEIKIELNPGILNGGDGNFFRGIITGVNISKYQGQAVEIVINGNSPSVLMDDEPHCQSFTDKSIKEIAEEVTSKYGLKVKMDPEYSEPIPYFTQYRESSYQFLSRLAGLFGEWFYYNGSEQIIGRKEENEAIDLIFGRDLSSLDIMLSAQPYQSRMISYVYVDHNFPESPSSSVKVPGLDEYGRLVSTATENIFNNESSFPSYYAVQNNKNLDEIARHRKSGKAGKMVTVQGISDNPRLSIGKTVSISGQIKNKGQSGLKDIKYGSFLIIDIHHKCDGLGNYQNDFIAIPSSLNDPPANPLVKKPFAEPQPAEIVDNRDPEKLGRVRVQFLWQKPSGDHSPWVRLSGSASGSKHGFYFVPETGDQVLVAFENNNPDTPYVLGGLYHGESKPENVADPDNNLKVIKTKSGNQILLSDKKGEEEIKIINGSNSISMSLSGSGKITIETEGDLELTGNNITINALQKLSMSSRSQSVLESGTSVKVGGQTADVDVSGKKVSLSGMIEVDVKGAMIKLNS